MNAATSSSTGYSPFYLNSAQQPRALTWNTSSRFPGVQRFVETLKEATMAAHDAIISARVAQTTQANKHRRDARFEVGQLVYLSTKN
ncbi:hypothetical protein AURDEDRAFT_77254, partial [Auricularia subglabra TFB-10046 SS5]